MKRTVRHQPCKMNSNWIHTWICSVSFDFWGGSSCVWRPCELAWDCVFPLAAACVMRDLEHDDDVCLLACEECDFVCTGRCWGLRRYTAYELVRRPFHSHFQCHDYNGAVPAGLIMQDSTRPAAVTLFHVVSTACMKRDLNKKNLIRIQGLVYTVYFPRHLLRISSLKGSYHEFSYLNFLPEGEMILKVFWTKKKVYDRFLLPYIKTKQVVLCCCAFNS